jgi:S1-C subfamily serine protease
MAKGFFSVICFSALMFFGAAAPSSAETFDVDAVRKSVVRIHSTVLTPDYRVPWNPGNIGRGTGTGFVIAGNLVMTNAHVVSNARFLGVNKEGNSKIFPARVQFVAHDCDLAILAIEDASFFDGMTALDFGDIPKLDSTVVACGYPIGGSRMSVTRGIVSRVEFNTYSHSSLDSHLTIQIDAAINPGNSGGPVMQGGKVVGVAFQGLTVAQNTGYMIPTPVVRRFLKDVEDGNYDGYVELAVNFFNLNNPAYRKIAQAPAGQDGGVIVDHVLTAGSAYGVLKPGDVLMKIDGHPITSDGHIQLGADYVQMEEIVERKFHGDKVVFDIFRDGKPEKASVTLKGAWPYRIMARHYGVRPEYVVFAGMLFQPLNRELLTAHKIKDPNVSHYFSFFVGDELYLERPQVVILSNILGDPINTHLNRFQHGMVDEVNGVKIRDMRDLDKALSAPAERYVITFIGNGIPVVIEADKLAEATQRIQQRYQVRELKYIGPKEHE